ncbi:MAG: pyridoxamine 5'-phosphate oxidase family protein [Syntrophales bacterium]|jgi:predicted pyridoxine 5'-phosphate oxidase superfamily flavin-nucleotide-binding protein|nr:pyridoxamine 5'-phosphate oxidase family protein [Syntrophales bacterium]NLN60359.1 pyridoxamine 5'-phosphate oxidase family protein [Deltaproteobacteria bacterium]
MAKMSSVIKELIETNKLAFIATTDANGAPNVSPKSTFSIIDDETFMFAEIMSTRTRENLLKNPKIAIYFFDKEKNEGCQVKGTAEMLSSGELFDEMNEALSYFSRKANYVVKVTVEDLFPWPPKTIAGSYQEMAGGGNK